MPGLNNCAAFKVTVVLCGSMIINFFRRTLRLELLVMVGYLVGLSGVRYSHNESVNF